VLHMGFANELAKTIVEQRAAGARIRRIPDGEVDRVEARLVADRQARAYEGRLSAAGAIALLLLIVVGPVALAALALGALLVAAIAPTLVDRLGRAFPMSDDRWQVWRRVDPDAEYLRGRA
jgi:hypothetical protein